MLHYQVEWQDEIVRFEVENGTSKGIEWFALGFSMRGDFERTDFCIIHKGQKLIVVSFLDKFERDYSNFLKITSTLFQDAHASDDGSSIIIDEQQDCNRRKPVDKHEPTENKVRFNRKFDTCDENDFPFHGGTINIYWMRGKSAVDILNGFNVSWTQIEFGIEMLQLLKTDEFPIPEG